MGKLETFPGVLPPMPAVARVLGQFDRDKLGAAIEVMIALLDLIDGDPEAEENGGDNEPSDGDDKDAAWIEWHTMSGSQKHGHNLLAGHEDDEQDDEPEDDDPSGVCDEDGVNTGSGEYWEYGRAYTGPGCPISDPGGIDLG